VLREKNQILVKVYNRKALDLDTIYTEYSGYAETLAPMIADTRLLLARALERGQNVLLEGSQATLLDVDHGTYPFVTSSSPTAGGAVAGSGIGPRWITRVIGIVKAYTTRVGSGPFPTELTGAEGEFLRKAGAEFGVTTGRARRCGWFDAVVARHSARVNGVTDFFLTKLDVLSGLDRVPICVAYEVDGERCDEMPMTQTAFHHVTPVFEYFDGWWEDIGQAHSFEDLPKNARDYVRAVEERCGAQISAIGVGPGRDQTLVLRDLLS
jgi:adenylosuccinate synthase